MKKKYNNDSPYFADWTTKKLKDEARGYDQMINQLGCYGTSDLRMYDGILAELNERGIEISSQITFS